MSVPSYEDLTPGIPAVVDAVASVASLLHEDGRPQPPPSDAQLAAAGSQRAASSVFACLRLGAASGERVASSRQREAVLAVARDFSPRVRRASDREVLLDVSGLGRLIGPPEEISRQLAHALFDAGAAASVAIAPTQTIARVLAQAMAEGLDAAAGAPGAWTQLPVQLLRELETLPLAMPDRDRARIYDTLERWGIATLGDLAALPAADLSSRLGRRGLALQRLARGFDPAPFVPDGETPRYVGRLELDWPIEALEPLSFVFARLLEPLSAALERADRGAAAVRLELRLTDRSTHGRVLQLPAAMRDPRVLRTLLLLDLESTPPFAAASESRQEPSRSGAASEVMIDVVTIEIDPAPARITQFSLLQRALPSPETLSTLTARLSALVGESRAGSPALVDSHAPDACVLERYAPERGLSADARSAKAAARSAEAAEGAAAGAVFRRQRPPLAIRVAVERGRPVHVAASKRGVPYGAVVQAAGPWRTSGGWWTAAAAEDGRLGKGAAWNRDEWDIALKTGAVCRIYRDQTTERWFLEGIYD